MEVAEQPVAAKITSIEGLPGQGSRFTVSLNGRPAFTVSAELVERLGLTAGAELGENEIRAIERDRERLKVKDAALRLLSLRARSRWELADRLRRRGFEPRAIERVLGDLEAVGLVDDREFAFLWADERVRLRPVGPRRLRAELLAKRVPDEIVSEVVRQTYEEHRQEELARAALKRRGGKGCASARERARAHAFLLRRGFDRETATRAVEEFCKELDDQKTDFLGH